VRLSKQATLERIARGNLSEAVKKSAEVTDTERVAIERTFDAAKKADEQYAKGEITLAAKNVAHQRYAEAVNNSRAKTREVTDASRELDDVLTEGAEILERLEELQREKADADREIIDTGREVEETSRGVDEAHREVEDRTRDVEDAQLDLAEAQRELENSGQDLIDSGPEALDYFRDIATEAGLTEDQIDNLIGKYSDLATAASRRRTGSFPALPPPPAPPSGPPRTPSGYDGGLTFENIDYKLRESIAIGGGIYGLATGGVVTGSIFANIGEGSSSELVLPLEDERGINMLTKALEPALAALGGGGGVQVGNIEINNPVAEPAGSSLARELRILSDQGMFG